MGNISGEQTLSSLFNGNFYRIPDYQRGYAWQDRKESNDKEHQLDDFWDDLLNLANHNLLNPQEKHKHYTGVLSLERVGDKEKEKPQWAKDEVAKNGEAYYIVDGQQRITTSMILLKVILDFVDSNKLNEFAGKKTQSLREKYVGAEAQSGEKYYFFGYTFDNPSYEFLKTQIFGDESSEYKGERSIYTKNLAFAKEFFSEKINAENAEIIFKTLTEDFVFNVYKISSDFDVYVAFETMNNRGKPLSSLELLKNRLIYLSTKLNGNEKGEKLRKDINEHWKVIYQYLGKNYKNVLKDDDFLKVHWLMYFDKYGRGKGNPHKEFLLGKFFTLSNLNKTITAETISDYAKNLRDCVEHYYFLYNLDDTDYKRNNKISNDSEMLVWLEKIQRLNFGAFEPLLVAVLYKRTENLKKGLNNDRDIVELLKHIEKFLFLMFMLIPERRASFKIDKIYEWAYSSFKGTNIIEISDAIRDMYIVEMLLDSLQTNIEIWFKKPNDGRYGYFAWKGIRYFLFEYEEFLRKQNKRNDEKIISWKDFIKYVKDSTTIEHILPQNTDNVDEWNNMLNQTDGIRKKHDKLRNYNIIKLKNSLGNLVPLSAHLNSEFQNKPFSEKKERYKTGSYAEIEISKYKEWNKKSIEERAKKLLDFMFERWGIDEILKIWEQNGYKEDADRQRKIKEQLVFSISE